MDLSVFFLSFIEDAFKESSELEYEKAKAKLDAFIRKLRSADELSPAGNAQYYLNQWVDAGYLSEIDGNIVKTAACDQALLYASTLDDMSLSTTKSRLSIVQEQIRTLAVETNPDINKRLQYYIEQRDVIDKQIKRLRQGELDTLPEQEIIERLREITLLTEGLPQDFRRLVEEMRKVDRELRENMIQNEANRGHIIEMRLDKEDYLSQSEAGKAFDGFYQLLSDTSQRASINEQVQQIIALPEAQYLTLKQRRGITHLFRILNRESATVRKARKTMSKKLSAYVKSDNLQSQRQISERLNCIEKLGLLLSKNDIRQRTPVGIYLNTGSLEIATPVRLKLSQAQKAINGHDIQVATNDGEISDEMIDSLRSVSMSEIEMRIKATLEKHGKAMTLAAIIDENPLTTGLEELITYVRVAMKVSATEFDDKEEIELERRDGEPVTTRVKTFLVSLGHFKESNDE